jgi:hypothetical protein
MRRGFWAVIAAATLLAGAARADVYEWRDPSGARHFTNSKQGVPAEYQAAAHIIVADWEHYPAAEAPAPAVPAAAAPPQPAQAEVATEGPPWNEAYAAGMRAAMELGGGGGAGGSVQINGPLAIASVRTPQTYGGYPSALYPPWPWYYPFVTTSFDRGRSRHQTLRMLLQDQFQLDREGPYAYQRWNDPGLGPALAPFLSRGLPYGVSQFGRVIFR